MCHTGCANVGIKVPLLPQLTCACLKKWNLLVLSARNSSSDISLWDSDIMCLTVMLIIAHIEHCTGKRIYCHLILQYYKYKNSVLSSNIFFSLQQAKYLQFLSDWECTYYSICNVGCTQFLKKQRARYSVGLKHYSTCNFKASNIIEISHLTIVNHHQQKIILFSLTWLMLEK